MLFQMLMTNTAESLKLGQAIQPVVFAEAPLVLETVDTPHHHSLHPPWSFVWCSNRHRCSSCLTQGHFSSLIATLYADGLHLSQQLSSRSCISHSPPPPPSLHFFLSITSPAMRLIAKRIQIPLPDWLII